MEELARKVQLGDEWATSALTKERRAQRRRRRKGSRGEQEVARSLGWGDRKASLHLGLPSTLQKTLGHGRVVCTLACARARVRGGEECGPNQASDEVVCVTFPNWPRAAFSRATPFASPCHALRGRISLHSNSLTKLATIRANRRVQGVPARAHPPNELSPLARARLFFLSRHLPNWAERNFRMQGLSIRQARWVSARQMLR